MDKWDKKTICLQHLMDNAQWLKPPSTNVPQAMFTLRRNDDPKGSAHCNRPRYDLSFGDGYMNAFWQGMWLIDVQATGQVPPVPDLPEWSDATNDLWTQTLKPISQALRAKDSHFPHLQGYMPLFNEHGTIAVDRVRMMYLDKVIKKSNGDRLDLVMVVLAYADVSSTHEDGAASGPPK
jgi:hypothetical protein